MSNMNAEDARKLKHYIQEKKTAKAEKTVEKVAQLCNWIGLIYAKYGQYDKAIQEHREEKHQCEKIDDKMGKAVACRLIGENCCQLGQFGAALEEQQTYLALAQECHDTLEEERAWNTLGKTFLHQADNPHLEKSLRANLHAEEAFSKALEISERAETSECSREHMAMKVRLFLNLGLVWDNTKEICQRDQMMEKALKIARENELDDELQMCTLSRATWFKNEKEYLSAILCYDTSLDIARKSNNKAKEMDIVISKAKCLAAWQDFHGATKCLEEAEGIHLEKKLHPKDLKKFKKIVSRMQKAADVVNSNETVTRQVCHSYEVIADSQVQLENFKEAIDSYSRVLCHSEMLNAKNKAAIYISLARTYADVRRYDMAISFYKKELEMVTANPEECCITNLRIAELEELDGSDFPVLKKIYDEAFQQAEKAENGKLMIQTLKEFLEVQKKFQVFDLVGRTKEVLDSLRQKHGQDESQEESFDTKATKENLSGEHRDDWMSNGMVKEDEDFTPSQVDRVSWIRGKARKKTLPSSSEDDDDEDDDLHGCTSRKAETQRIHSKWIKKTSSQVHSKEHNLEKSISSDGESSDSPQSLRFRSKDDGSKQTVQSPNGRGSEGDKSPETETETGNFYLLEPWDIDLDSPTGIEKEPEDCPGWKKRRAGSAEASDDADPNERNSAGIKRQKRDDGDTTPFGQALSGVKTSHAASDNHNKLNPYGNSDSSSNESALTTQMPDAGQRRQSDTVLNKHEASRTLNVFSTRKDEVMCWYGGNKITSEPETENQCERLVHDSREICSEAGAGELSSVHVHTTKRVVSREVKMIVKLEINGKKMIVPVFVGDESKSFTWFSERVADRYFNLFFIYPEKLIFMTKDGYMLSPSDPIGTLSTADFSELRADVYSWSVRTAVKRYEQACRTFNENPKPFFLSAFGNLGRSRVIDFSDINLGHLNDTELLPVWQALKAESSITELRLNGSRFGDSSVSFLKKLLACFPCLTDLKLESNNLSVKAFECLASFIQNGSKLDSLRSLSISYNRLMDAAESALCSLLGGLPHLSNLNLACCSLTSKVFTSNLLVKFSRCSLERLNVSDNHLTRKCLQSLLTSLKKNQLRHLDLSRCLMEETDDICLAKVLDPVASDPSCCLQSLSLAGCHLGKEDVLICDRFPILIPSLQQLDVSSNSNVTNMSLQNLLSLSAYELCELKSFVAKEGSVRSPLSDEVVEALKSKLQSKVPLETLIFTCEDMTKADSDSVQSVWLRHWGDSALVSVTDTTVNLSVKNQQGLFVEEEKH